MLSKLRNKKGFTLIELMIVVAIIGILAALAIPDFMKMMAKSKQSEAKTNLGAIFNMQKSYFGEKNTFSDRFDLIGWAPEGQNLYFYWVPNESITTKKGDITQCATSAPNVAISYTGFTAGATGNIDNDPSCDAWTVDDVKHINAVVDDVKD